MLLGRGMGKIGLNIFLYMYIKEKFLENLLCYCIKGSLIFIIKIFSSRIVCMVK